MRRSRAEHQQYELNLAPIMNIVMILIPLLLITASFVVVATLNVNSPRNAQSVTPEEQQEEQEVPVPRVLVSITENGFIVNDMRQSPAFAESGLGTPLSHCAGAQGTQPGMMAMPITICNPATRATDQSISLLDRLDYRGLYNRLVEIKTYSAWNAQWNDDNQILNIMADREIPFEVVVRTMDIARYYLGEDGYENDEEFRTAVYREESEGEYSKLFPDPVLLLPRTAAAN
jgi:biopolymer transport protein ExbD